jgi:hypothetical protein
MTLYGIDAAKDVAGRLFDAWSRKTPEPRQVQETQLLTGGENGSGGGAGGMQPAAQKQMTYQEFYVYLLNKGALTPEEQQWKTSYEDYITKAQQDRLSTTTKQQAPATVQQQSPSTSTPQRQQLDEALYANSENQEQEQVAQPEREREPEQQSPDLASSRKPGFVERLQQLEADNGKYTA